MGEEKKPILKGKNEDARELILSYYNERRNWDDWLCGFRDAKKLFECNHSEAWIEERILIVERLVEKWGDNLYDDLGWMVEVPDGCFLESYDISIGNGFKFVFGGSGYEIEREQ